MRQTALPALHGFYASALGHRNETPILVEILESRGVALDKGYSKQSRSGLVGSRCKTRL